jgi:hypothetical protein
MHITVKANAQELLGEAKLLQRLKLKSKVDHGTVLSSIAVKDRTGCVRLIIDCHADSEESSSVWNLDNAGFFDELIVDTEEVNEDGLVECGEVVEEHPQFDYVYVFGQREPVRTEAPKQNYPGPD